MKTCLKFSFFLSFCPLQSQCRRKNKNHKSQFIPVLLNILFLLCRSMPTQKKRLLTNFSITKNAKERIDEIKQDSQDVFIRIMITSGGCAGHQYHILMDDYIGETDYILRKRYKHKNSVYVVIDETSLEFVKGSKLDYTNDLEFSGFKINNPNIKFTCHCGESFSCFGDCTSPTNGTCTKSTNTSN